MAVHIDIEVATGDDAPDPETMSRWLQLALASQLPADKPTELSVRIVDAAESQTLNAQYRQQDKPTNVLSFPADMPADLPVQHLGDIVICASVVNREAAEQQKSEAAHWAHMCIHGTLHLLGFDHIETDDAEIMEALETELLAQLDFPAPYEYTQPHSLHN